MTSDSGFTGFLSAVAFVAVCAYILAFAFPHLTENSLGLETVTVCRSIHFEGIAVRREKAIESRRGIRLFDTSGRRIPAGGIAAAAEDGEAVISEKSALLFADTDGFEYLAPPTDTFTENTPEELMDSESRDEEYCGRLVTGRYWYIAAYAENALPAMSRCRIRVDGTDEVLTAWVCKHIPAQERGYAVLLRLSIGKTEYLSLRRCAGELILEEYTGLEVPESAVYTREDGGKYVRMITASGEKDTAAEIIYNEDGRCLVRETDELTAGTRIKG